ncbi:protein REVEILLE 7-like isoform X1 [Quercus lobata]|uniref:Uncharacterized protein n=1 Tax=Quercus lobata TaxID=97700 RepID=A0A7N2MTH9_QUELO|nr:protein REVEILLE 7-like isoform X1 [Quercus lobata]
MDIQGQNELTTSNADNYHPDGSVKSETAVKVRKPYTITKQREKWTEEEHQKFLEALKLYGRGWRQIEAHVGTKTAVQIRSHAQKFFSKVVRASSSSTESSIEPVEIPPPRPKRKPLHPYPRKLADSLNGISVADQSERSPSPYSLVAEKDTESPTSVFSAVGSDALGSGVSEQHNVCPSPMSCTTDMHSISLATVEKENEHMMVNSSVQEEKLQKFESASKETLSTDGDEAMGAIVSSIKLFGRTVLVTDSQKPCSPGAENIDSPTSKAILENLDIDTEKFPETLPSNQLDTHLSLEIVNCDWRLLPCRAPVQCMEHQKENTNSAEANPYASLPWLALYQGLPYYHLPSYNQTSVQIPTYSCVEEKTKERDILKEKSCSGSNSVSASEVENEGKNLDAVDSQFQETRGRINPCKSMKGFAPYKRCLAERDANSSVIVLEEREGQRARVCSY